MVSTKKAMNPQDHNDLFLVVLGIAQDGGYPHVGTRAPGWTHPEMKRHAAALGIVDRLSHERWIIEATPDFREQFHLLDEIAPFESPKTLSGICISHAHIGHYTGLMFLGKEMLDAELIPVYTMPRMHDFLQNNLPWKELIARQNISLKRVEANIPVHLNQRITLTPIPIPHRDEYSETVGFLIEGPNSRILFVPDIDRWEDLDPMDSSIEKYIADVDCAFLDGTFFNDDELPGRDLSTIPHPTVESSLRRLASMKAEERQRINFIHLNHTNPLLDEGSEAYRRVKEAGMSIAKEGECFAL